MLTGSGTVEFYDTPTVTTNGSVANMYNKNRAAAGSPTLTIYHGPTVTSDGTLLESFNFGSSGGFKQIGAPDTFWVLRNNSLFLIKYTSSSSNNVFSEQHFWTETTT